MKEESTHERNHEATFARSRTENHSKHDPPRIRWLAAPKLCAFLPAPPARKASDKFSGEKIISRCSSKPVASQMRRAFSLNIVEFYRERGIHARGFFVGEKIASALHR